MLSAKPTAILANLFAVKGFAPITAARFCGCFSYEGIFVDRWRYIEYQLQGDVFQEQVLGRTKHGGEALLLLFRHESERARLQGQ